MSEQSRKVLALALGVSFFALIVVHAAFFLFSPGKGDDSSPFSIGAKAEPRQKNPSDYLANAPQDSMNTQTTSAGDIIIVYGNEPSRPGDAKASSSSPTTIVVSPSTKSASPTPSAAPTTLAPATASPAPAATPPGCHGRRRESDEYTGKNQVWGQAGAGQVPGDGSQRSRHRQGCPSFGRLLDTSRQFLGKKQRRRLESLVRATEAPCFDSGQGGGWQEQVYRQGRPLPLPGRSFQVAFGGKIRKRGRTILDHPVK